ncbi:MAG TPA: hypothetical protein VGE07_02440 [Herpetosiphonaceae bacterium]
MSDRSLASQLLWLRLGPLLLALCFVVASAYAPWFSAEMIFCLPGRDCFDWYDGLSPLIAARSAYAGHFQALAAALIVQALAAPLAKTWQQRYLRAAALGGTAWWAALLYRAVEGLRTMAAMDFALGGPFLFRVGLILLGTGLALECAGLVLLALRPARPPLTADS